jgi:hypothetical protein
VKTRLRPWITPFALVVGLAVLFAGLLLRIQVLRSGSGWLNADEAATGIMAMDILHGRFPIVLVGNAYTAVFESYLFAPFIAVFGAHVVPLKLVSVIFWGLASLAMFGAARHVMSRIGAGLAGALVWLAPGALLVLSTLAYAGYSLGLAVVAATLWSLFVIVGGPEPGARQSALSGGLLGLAFYIHPMLLAVVVPGALVVSIRHFRQLRRWWLPAVGAAFAVNIPFLMWNAANGYPSLDIPSNYPGSYGDRLEGFFTGLMPRVLGLLDSPGTWIWGRPAGIAVYSLVLLAVMAGAVVLSRRGWKGAVAVATVTLVWPLMALFSALIYVSDGRYGIVPFVPVILCIAAAIDAATGALSTRASRTRPIDPEPAPVMESKRLAGGIAVAAAALWLVLSIPYLDSVVGPAVPDPNASINALVTYLDEEGFDRIAGSYWVIQRVEYMTDGRIPGAATPPHPVRSPRFQEIVESSPPEEVAHVFTPDDEWVASLPLPIEAYRREIVDGFVVYVPLTEGVEANG